MSELQTILGEVQIAPQLSQFFVRVCHSALAKNMTSAAAQHQQLADILAQEKALGRLPHPALVHLILCKKELSHFGPLQQFIGGEESAVHALGEHPPGWLQALVGDINVAVAEQGEHAASVFACAPSDAEYAMLNEAMGVLRQHMPPAFSLVHSMVHDIVLVGSQAFIGATSKSFLGGILLNPKLSPSVPHYIDTLVHEASHIELYLRQMLDPFLQDETRLLASPLRKSLRPAGAVLHASFVLSRVCFTLAHLLNVLPQWSWRDAAQGLLLDNFRAFEQGLQMMHNMHDLSQAGLQLRNNMDKLAGFLRDQPCLRQTAVA